MRREERGNNSQRCQQRSRAEPGAWGTAPGTAGGWGWRGGERDGGRDGGAEDTGREGCKEGWRGGGTQGEMEGRGEWAEGCRRGMHGGMERRRDGEEEGCRREGRRAGSGVVADSTIAWHLTAGTATARSGGVMPAPVPWTGNYSQHPRASVSPTAAPCTAVPDPGKVRAAPTNTQRPTDPRPAVGTAAVSPWQELEDSRRGRVWGQTDQGCRE